jgi:hypothetical protein
MMMNLPTLLIATDFRAQKIEKKFPELTKYATNELGNAKIIDAYGLRYFAYPKDQFKIVSARLDLYWYFHLRPSYDLSYFMTLEEDYFSIKDHLKIHQEISKRELRKNRLVFSCIGLGVGSVLTTVAIILIKSAIQ